jgi:pyruvate/2-oxoacid:ferredoxin oxidoreductase beta subunit
MKIKDLPKEELFASGHTACPGCGGAIAVRLAMKIFGKNTIVYVPACCLVVFGATYPQISWKVPFLDVAFENTGAVIAGIKAGLEAKKKKCLVVGFAGDGGTADIGLQALSGAAERNDDVIYICYDNEAYMNTGIQRSGSTQYGAWTTTTPIGSQIAGETEFKKDVPRIILAHDVPYVATASISYPMDYLRKLKTAKNLQGFRYIQVNAPCPTGWKFAPEKTIEIGKLAVETGLWYLYEAKDGKFEITYKPMKKRPVIDYLKMQGRFSHLSQIQINRLEEYAQQSWNKYYSKKFMSI